MKTSGSPPPSPKADLHPSDQEVAEAEVSEAAEDELFAFRHYMLRNIRYHARRANWFAQWHKITGFVGVLLGSTSALSFLLADSPLLGGITAAIVAMFSAADLVVGNAAKEAEHRDLRKRWIALQHDLEANGFTQALYAARTTIEMDEPPELSIVEMQAHNDATLAMLGDQDDVRDYLLTIAVWQRFVGQFINLDTSHITTRSEIEDSSPKEKPGAAAQGTA